MIDQYVLATNDDGDLAIRTVSATESSSVTDTTSVITATDDGKLAVRVVGSGGGGGSDPHNLGYYADLTALQTAHPTGTNGDFAILGSTDTIWVWDSGTSAWKDTDTKGQVTSVNGQTGAVTVQETLVNQTNIKSIDGNSLLGSGNLELSTYLTYPAGWTTNSTTKAFCDDIAADSSAVKGKAYLGEVTFSDLPASMVNGEIVVEIMDGTTAANKVIVLSLKSGNVSPYAWQYVYWNGGSNTSGWKTWQEPLVSGTNIKTVNGTSLLGSGDITTEAIQVSTMPTAAVGELGNVYQFIGTTDANYTHGYFYECVSDGQNPATYSWTQTDVQPGSSLPSQSGNSGKFLTTDGASASWANALTNKSSASLALAILGSATQRESVAIGVNATASTEATAIGCSSSAGFESVAVGWRTHADGAYSTAVGEEATASGQSSVALGLTAQATAQNAIQIGYGINSTANTLSVGLGSRVNVRLLSADGTIPTDRLTKVNSTITLTAAGWSSNTQTVNVTGMTATGVVMVSPDPTDQSAYTSAGILCTAQAAGTLTFTCTSVPSGDIDVNVVML